MANDENPKDVIRSGVYWPTGKSLSVPVREPTEEEKKEIIARHEAAAKEQPEMIYLGVAAVDPDTREIITIPPGHPDYPKDAVLKSLRCDDTPKKD